MDFIPSAAKMGDEIKTSGKEMPLLQAMVYAKSKIRIPPASLLKKVLPEVAQGRQLQTVACPARQL